MQTYIAVGKHIDSKSRLIYITFPSTLKYIYDIITHVLVIVIAYDIFKRI